MKFMPNTVFSIVILFGILCGETSNVQAQDAATVGTGPVPADYQDDPSIAEKLESLDSRTGLMLPQFKVMPTDAAKHHYSFKNGPHRRDFGNKMAYAPDRGTALYCGANHNVPHRLNDVWEFHLGSNTWHLILPPANDATHLRGLQNKVLKAKQAIEQNNEVEQNQAIIADTNQQIKKWYQTCRVANGYLQATQNGGPIRPWHTWDGITYDTVSKRLYWAVLDSDNFQNPKSRVHARITQQFARFTDQDPEALVAQLKPSSSMYMYDPAQGRWFRQIGEGPFPVMRAMGGSLHYLPDQNKTIWYCAATNIPGGEFAMWSYDAKTNRWTDLKPNGGESIAKLAYSKDPKQLKAPGGELQIAYSPRFKKLVSVHKEHTFIYDVASNEWSRGMDNPGFGWDSLGVFAYDDKADVFLLFSRKGGVWSDQQWSLAAYDVAQDKWEVVDVKGQFVPKLSSKAWTREAYAGYFDSKQNVFVLYLGRSKRTWVYRHRKID